MADAGSDPMVFPRVSRTRGPAARAVTWWGKAWVRSFEETVLDASDLPRARSLARSGRLGAVVVLAGMASVVVDPDREHPVMAQLKLSRLPESAWARFAAELARESGHVAALEAGELPTDLVEHTDQLGVELLPGPGDFETACECDAWAQPCPHAAALLYQLAWHLDRDPYVLVLLRGRTREELIEGPAPDQDPDAGAEIDDTVARAAEILRLARDAPSGHGLADSAVAAYDEAISELLPE